MSLNKGNVSSLKDKFGTTTSSSSGLGTGRYSSLDRSYSHTGEYGGRGDYGRSGYSSDVDAGSSKSYGSWGRPSSVGVARQSSYTGSVPASREVSPVRTSGSRSSRMDYSRSTSTTGSRDYSRAPSSSRDYGTSYNKSYSRPEPSSSHLKSKDYNLTPFSTRRTTKSSDTNLTPFSTRRSSTSVEPAKVSHDKEPATHTSTTTSNDKSSRPSSSASSRDDPRKSRRSRIDSDASTDSADEPVGGNKDSSIKYLTSRACSPMEPDFEFYESNKEARKNKKRKRLIARTKTKIYPVKSYKRKRDRPRLKNQEIQVDIEDLDRNCGRYRYDRDRYNRMKQDRLSGYKPSSSTHRNSVSKDDNRRNSISKEDRRHSISKDDNRSSRTQTNSTDQSRRSRFHKQEPVSVPSSTEEPVPSPVPINKTPRWKQMPQAKRDKTKGSILPRQSGFRSSQRKDSENSVTETEEEEDECFIEPEKSKQLIVDDDDDESFSTRQSSFYDRQKKRRDEEIRQKRLKDDELKKQRLKEEEAKQKKKKNEANQDKSNALTIENMSLKDSIEKVKNWKRQLKMMPPDSPDIHKHLPGDRQSKKTAPIPYESDYTEDEDIDDDVSISEEMMGTPIVYSKSEHKKSQMSPSSRRSSNERVLSPSGSEETGFLREESPNRDISHPHRGKDKKMCAGVPQFSVNQHGQRLKPGHDNRPDRSPSPYDNVDRQSKRHTRDDQPTSPYNDTSGRNRPHIVIEPCEPDLGDRMVPAMSMDSLASGFTSDDGSFGSGGEADISRAQSMVSLNTFPSSSLPRKRGNISKAMSMDSLATSVSSLPDLVQSSQGSRVGYTFGLQDIDSLLGFTETEDDFSDDFTDENDDSESFYSADELPRKRNIGDSDIVLSPVKEEGDPFRGSNGRPVRTKVDEIIYVSDQQNIDDILGEEEAFTVVSTPQIIDNFQMNDISNPDLSLAIPPANVDISGSSDSLLDTPVPDTPGLPLAPIMTPGGSSMSNCFPFPPQRTHSVDELNTHKKEKQRGFDKSKSTANLDDLDSLLDTISAGDKHRDHHKTKQQLSAFELLTRDGKDSLQDSLSSDQTDDSSDRLVDFDLLDSSRPLLDPDMLSPVPTAKLIDLSSDSNQSTPRHGSPAVKHYPPDYSAAAVKQTISIQEEMGVVTMKDLLQLCVMQREVRYKIHNQTIHGREW